VTGFTPGAPFQVCGGDASIGSLALFSTLLCCGIFSFRSIVLHVNPIDAFSLPSQYNFLSSFRRSRIPPIGGGGLLVTEYLFPAAESFFGSFSRLSIETSHFAFPFSGRNPVCGSKSFEIARTTRYRQDLRPLMSSLYSLRLEDVFCVAARFSNILAFSSIGFDSRDWEVL